MKPLCILCLLISLIFYVNSRMEDSIHQLQLQKHRKRGSQPNIFQCITCKSGTGKVLNMILSPSTNESISKTIETLCMETGPFSTSCRMFASELSSQVFYLFRHIVPQKWCAFLGFCYYPPIVPVCRCCINTGKLIKSMLLSKPFLSELYNNTLTICDKLPKLSIVCNSLLHDIFMAITLSFKEQFIVYRLCKNAGFCRKISKLLYEY
ncbi:unnamed protein product [Schistosoma rodhaini]|uniref:Saposin B-type domain-containing protein n=1 Tax=Schistosoma rodhaini TaxID=6188 RepID=A0AA85FGT4_9TREM|nr:unnamed protein product [Schistosoma rodhaini]